LVWKPVQRVDLFKQLSDQIGGTPAIADINQDGIAEVYSNNKIFNALTGVKLLDGGSNGIGTEFSIDFVADALSVAAQLDDDTTDLELAAGYTIYKVRISNINGTLGISMVPINIEVDNKFRDGLTSVADINLDGKLEVIVTSPGLGNDALVYVYSLKNGVSTLLAKSYPTNISYSGIGPAFIGDIEGNGTASIIISKESFLQCYKYDGSSTLQLYWNFITQDTSSFNAVTMFDFNYDGVQEIVYHDEIGLRIIDGSSRQPREIINFACY